jgi:hypothetical protein
MGLGSGIRDPRSGIRKKPIPDPASRGQKGTGSRIPDPDPQHWFNLSSYDGKISYTIQNIENYETYVMTKKVNNVTWSTTVNKSF